MNRLEQEEAEVFSRLNGEKNSKKPNGSAFDPKEFKEEKGPLFVDLGPILDGKLERERPSIAPVSEDRFLFYKGRLNSIHGEPSVGKTNLLIYAINVSLAAGLRVVYIDPEDNPTGFCLRALALGGDPKALRGLHYQHNPTGAEITDAITWAKENHPDLVICDGIAESLAAEGLNENDPGHILSWFRHRMRPFAELGAAVVIADHVVKSADNRGNWPRGSGAKMGRYDGVVYSADLLTPYSPDRAGSVGLKICKDRNGGAGVKGQPVGALHFTPSEHGNTSVEWKEAETGNDGKPIPTDAIAAILDTIRAAGKPLTGTQLEKGIPMRANTIRWARDCAVKMGRIVQEPGPRGGWLYSLGEEPEKPEADWDPSEEEPDPSEAAI